jgi:hypothetical protein
MQIFETHMTRNNYLKSNSLLWRSLVEKARKQTEQMEIIGENYHIWYDTITKDYDG